MTRGSQKLTVPLPSAEALDVCAHSLLALGWEVVRAGDRIDARERASSLCCRVSPVGVGVEARAADAEGSTVELAFESRGIGPLERRRLNDSMRAVALTIARQV